MGVTRKPGTSGQNCVFCLLPSLCVKDESLALTFLLHLGKKGGEYRPGSFVCRAHRILCLPLSPDPLLPKTQFTKEPSLTSQARLSFPASYCCSVAQGDSHVSHFLPAALPASPQQCHLLSPSLLGSEGQGVTLSNLLLSFATP